MRIYQQRWFDYFDKDILIAIVGSACMVQMVPIWSPGMSRIGKNGCKKCFPFGPG